MANDTPQNDTPQNLTYTPIGVQGVVEVSAHLVGNSLIDSLRRIFTTNSQIEQGDFLMDRSLDLLERHHRLMVRKDQKVVRHSYMKARKLKLKLYSDDNNGSQFQRFFRARQYKRLSKTAYEVAKLTSDKVRENSLFNQLVGAIQSSTGDPFTDSHEVSTLTDVSVNDLDRVEISTYQEEATNEAAVVLDFVAQDESAQHVVATFPTDAFSGDRTDREAPAAISLHRDDGSLPRIIAVSLPDISDERADEQAETSTLDSLASSELVTLEGNRPHPVPLASVRPTEDPYTRTFVPRRPL